MRAKGRKYENELVSHLTRLGFQAWRVPLSGALGGRFSSDVRLTLAGKEYRVEVKMRATPKAASLARLLPLLPVACAGWRVFYLEQVPNPSRTCAMPKRLAQWLQGADLLAVRLPKRYTQPHGGQSGWVIVLPDTLSAEWRNGT